MMDLEQLAKQGRRTETFTTAATINRKISQARKASLRNSFIDCEHIRHRNELVDTHNGVNFIDDSDARSVSATYFTLSDTTTSTVWITIGGYDDYEDLIPVVRQCVTAVICINDCGDNVSRTFGSVVRGGVRKAADMQEAMKIAENIAVYGQNVLYSPAGKSLSMDDAKLASDFLKLTQNN